MLLAAARPAAASGCRRQIDGATGAADTQLDDDSGSDSRWLHTFSEPDTGWATVGGDIRLTAADRAAGDHLGWSVAINDDTVVVGAPENDSQALDAGAGYIYQTSDWTAIADSAPGKANATSYTIADLVNGVHYSARVRAVNGVGASNPSHAIAFTPMS